MKPPHFENSAFFVEDLESPGVGGFFFLIFVCEVANVLAVLQKYKKNIVEHTLGVLPSFLKKKHNI